VLTLLVNVSARREGTTCSGKDDAADCLVRFDDFKQLLDLRHHCPVHGVELIGPVQRDSDDAVFGFGKDGLVTHRCSPSINSDERCRPAKAHEIRLTPEQRRLAVVPAR
jgi:hypothetical protein